MAVVLGLVLRRDRLAAVRRRALARGAREPAERDAPRRLHRPRRLLGPAAEPRAARLLQRRLAARRDDRDDPAAAARLGLAAGGRRPRRRAADRHPPRVAAGQPRPRRRRAAVAGAARRVGARLVAEVRPGLGPPAARRLRLPAAGRAQPPARLGRAPDPRSRLAGALRGDDQRALVPGPGRGRRAVDHPGDRRPALGRAQRPLPRRGAARRRPARRLDLGGARRRWRCPTCPRRSAGAWSRSTCSTRRATGSSCPPPSVSAAEPSFEPNRGPGRLRRYWRGPTWVNAAWMLWLGLRRLGYEAEAAR